MWAHKGDTMEKETLDNIFPFGVKDLEDDKTLVGSRALGNLGVSIYIPKRDNGYSRGEAEFIGKRILRGVPVDGLKGRAQILENPSSYIVFMEFSLENLAENLEQTEVDSDDQGSRGTAQAGKGHIEGVEGVQEGGVRQSETASLEKNPDATDIPVG